MSSPRVNNVEQRRAPGPGLICFGTGSPASVGFGVVDSTSLQRRRTPWLTAGVEVAARAEVGRPVAAAGAAGPPVE